MGMGGGPGAGTNYSLVIKFSKSFEIPIVPFNKNNFAFYIRLDMLDFPFH